MAFAVSDGIGGRSWLARPNTSLTRRGQRLLLLAVAVVSLGIAGAFAAVGAWLVLPFAGLELLVLWLVLRYLERHSGDYEAVRLADGRLSVEVRHGPTCQREDCAACWMRFFLCRPENVGSLRLRFRAYGRHIDVGRWMSEEELRALSAALRDAVQQPRNYPVLLIKKEGQ